MEKAAKEEQQMYRRLVRPALRLGLLVTLVVLALSACVGGDEEAKARPLPEEYEVLRPGTYLSEKFEPPLSFTVGEGWTNFPPEASDDLRLIHGEQTERKLLRFVNVQEVYEPTRTGTPNVVKAPKDMVGWFQEHLYLQTDNPEPVTVGGVKGEQLDVVVGDLPEDYSGECGFDCVDIFRTSVDPTVALLDGYKARVFFLEDVKGETVLIGFVSPAAEFDEFAPRRRRR